MVKRFVSIFAAGAVLIALGGCTNKKVVNPIANVSSAQPDKVLFDRSMDAMKHGKYDVARITLQTLINTYPDSEYVARAKLAIGDSWYAEGGSAALIQAENEYKDFETFFPNMPEAAEAQLKIANIHYREMEKPDRDFTHAKRAEEEYRYLITTWPDSKLVPEAKERLLQVQEVLAEREFRIGRFYYMRESWIAAQARLKSLVDTYPLYSQADEALYMLGESYEKQIENVRAAKFNEVLKGQMIKELTQKSAEAYSRIITRYPVMPRAEDAKKRLADLHMPIPSPTPEAIAQNKKEEQGRSENSMFQRMKLNLRKGPDLAAATKYGDPTLVDPQPTNAPDLVRQANESMINAAKAMSKGSGKITAEPVKEGAVPVSQPIPRSDDSSQPAENSAVPELQPVTNSDAQPSAEGGSALPPTQINQMNPQPGTDQSAQPADQASDPNAQSGQTQRADQASQSSSKDQSNDDFSTSKKKKKKGLGRLNPF